MSHTNFIGSYGEEGGGGKRPAEGTNVMILHNSFSVVSSKSNFFTKVDLLDGTQVIPSVDIKKKNCGDFD